jgi:hypothetical protein
MRVPYEPDIGPPPFIINITNAALRRPPTPQLLPYRLRGRDPNAYGTDFVHLTAS